ncbi:acetylglutamate kinase [candidate division NPL-UPA2 bacterium]|nr:acetylglutamate kinase [candidate division NPL-UPA2 bacterium]
MEKAIEKAGILVEALPYIKKFYGKTIVIKYGGSTIASGNVEKNFIIDVVLMKYVGMNPIIIHGGGPLITKALKEAGKGTRFVGGLRVTDRESINIVSKILSRVNQEIVSLIKKVGGQAVGLDDIVKAERYPAVKEGKKEADIGFVGKVKGISSELAGMVEAREVIPVINPLGKEGDGEALNVNADEAAARIAAELRAEKFFILTDVPGIMRDWEDKESLISTLTIDEARHLMEEEVIIKGMLPKVKACMKALQGGVGKVHIVDGRVNHSLLLEIFTDEGIGTQMVKQR